MKRNVFIAFMLLLFLLPNCKNVIGPSLPDELKGTWRDDWGYYYLEYEFTKNHVYYHDYASNTGGSASWDCDVDEVLTDDSFIACSDNYYFHVSGNTLYLKKESSSLSLSSNWWSDNNVSKQVLTKQ